MKKFISFTIVLLLVFNYMVFSNAADGATVYADKTVMEKDTLTLIPVKIKDNKGIMGYRITVESTAKNVKIVSVKRGEVTKTGNFNTSFGVETDSFDVLWNSTESIKEDGTIFILGVKADDYFDSRVIELSYTTKDTFNEKYEDVLLSCENIEITCQQGAASNIEEKSADSEVEHADNYVSLTDEQLIDGVKFTLEQMNESSLDDIKADDEVEFVETLNENLQKTTGSDQTFYNTFHDVTIKYNTAYKSFFVDKVLNSADSDKIKAAIDYALEKNDIKDIYDLNEKNEKKFVKDVEIALKDLNPDIPSISEDVDIDTAASAVKKIYGGLALTEAADDYVHPEKSNKTTIIIIFIAAVVLIVVIVSVIIKIIKSKGEKTK